MNEGVLRKRTPDYWTGDTTQILFFEKLFLIARMSKMFFVAMSSRIIGPFGSARSTMCPFVGGLF